MKKNRLMKVVSILAAAIMTSSAAMTAVSADYTEEASVAASLTLQNVEAGAGEIVEVPLTMYSDNQCTLFDLSIEFDNRLEFVEADGAKACEYEEAGKNFISLVRFEDTPYEDGSAVATVKFEVPEDAAVGEMFSIDFAQITTFSSFFGDFEDYTLQGAVVTVNKEFDPSIKTQKEKAMAISDTNADGRTIALEGREAVPGELVEVPLVMYTDNQCTNYDLLVEYDARLEFQFVSNAKAITAYEESGRKYIAIAGYQTSPYKDGQAAASIGLYVPEETKTDDYTVKFSQVSSFSSDEEDFEEYKTEDTFISVVANETESLSDAKIFKNYDVRGTLRGTSVGLRGDVDKDGKTTIRDAAAIAIACASQKIDRFDEQSKFFGDVNDDGDLNIRDAAKIARYIAAGKVTWDFK